MIVEEIQIDVRFFLGGDCFYSMQFKGLNVDAGLRKKKKDGKDPMESIFGWRGSTVSPWSKSM